MEKLGDIKLYSFEEIKDEFLGKVGTPERDEFERKVAEAVRAYHMAQINLPRPPRRASRRHIPL